MVSTLKPRLTMTESQHLVDKNCLEEVTVFKDFCRFTCEKVITSYSCLCLRGCLTGHTLLVVSFSSPLLSSWLSVGPLRSTNQLLSGLLFPVIYTYGHLAALEAAAGI